MCSTGAKSIMTEEQATALLAQGALILQALVDVRHLLGVLAGMLAAFVIVRLLERKLL